MSAEERSRDQRIVDAVLAEEGLADEAALAAVLLQVRAQAAQAAPAMSPELLAALAASPAIESPPGSLNASVVSLERHRGRKRRALIASAAVLAAMGLGVGAAAASSEGFRQVAQNTFSGLVGVLNPGRQAAPEPQLPAPVTTDGEGHTGDDAPTPKSTPTPTNVGGEPTESGHEEAPLITAIPLPEELRPTGAVPEKLVPEKAEPVPTSVPGFLKPAQNSELQKATSPFEQ